MRVEATSKIGEWTLVSEVDQSLSTPLWIGDNGAVVVYVRIYRVRSLKAIERLQQLATWAAAFEHNCILPVREVHEVVGGSAVISSYEEGQPLASVLARARIARKPVPPPVAAAVALDMLDGLHATGGTLAPAWAHGGLRPEAVLITRGGKARVMEVGISGEVAQNEPLSSDKKWVAYAAPEQLAAGQLTEQTDVFTVAAITWEMLVGKPLFEARDVPALKKLISRCEVRRADEVARTDVPKTLAMVIEQALEADAEERFQTTTAFANALRSAAPAVAEPIEVSRYLEDVQRVALDTRRRSLGQALGRAAPTSMPPAAARTKGVQIPKFAAPPRIPSFALTPTPPKAAPKPFGQPLRKPAPKPPPVPDEPEREEDERPSGEVEQRLSAPLELMTPKPPAPPPDQDDELSWTDEAPGDDAPGDEPPPSLGVDIPIDESTAGEPPPSLGEDIPVDASSAGEPPPSLGEDIPVDASSAGEPPPSSEDAAVAPPREPAARAAVAKAVQAVPPAEISKPGPPIDPFADLQLEDDPDLYKLRSPRRWPWFVLGVLAGAGGAFGVVYRAPHLLPIPLPHAPAPPVTAQPATAPTTPPSEVSPEPSVSPSASASADGDAKPARRPRRRAPRAPAVEAPVPEAPVPEAPVPEPVEPQPPAKPPPAPPPAKPSDIYDN